MTIRKKIFIIIGILIFGILITNIGLPLRFNSIYAKIDIRLNNIQIVKIDNPILHRKELNRLTEKYGFKYTFISDSENLSDLQKDGILNYNSVIEKYLGLRNEENWKSKIESKIDSIGKTKIPAIY